MDKEKPRQLPIVARETVDIYFRDVERRHAEGMRSVANYCNGVADRLERENPQLARFIDDFCKALAVIDENKAMGARNGLYSMYDVLQRQIDADNL